MSVKGEKDKRALISTDPSNPGCSELANTSLIIKMAVDRRGDRDSLQNTRPPGAKPLSTLKIEIVGDSC